MIECVPISLFSGNFEVRGLASGAAIVEYRVFSEQGRIFCAGREYVIRKYGVFSGHWTLEHAGAAVASGRKVSAMCRHFEISGESLHLTLRAESVMGRAFEIKSGYSPLGYIRPVHPFTRKATIQCADAVPECIQLFCFWLAALTWRRSANAAASS